LLKRLKIELRRIFHSIYIFNGISIGYQRHNILNTYNINPAVRYVNKYFSKVHHFINSVPVSNNKPFIIEFEHILFMSGESRDYKKMIESVDKSKSILESELCKAIILWSEGTRTEMKKYIDISKIEHKIHIIRPASNLMVYDMEESERPFTVLNIGNKFWAKGTFAAIEAFKRFNLKYPETKFNIVCNDVPSNFDISKHINIDSDPMMTTEKKENLFKMSDVFLLPTLHDSFIIYLESFNYKVPVITTNIFDKDEIVLDNKCGYLVNTPISLYDDNIGIDYKNYDEFILLIQKKYKDGEFEEMINKMVEKLDYLYNNRDVLSEMGDNCHSHLVNNFSIEQRNLKLKEVYQNSLKEL